MMADVPILEGWLAAVSGADELERRTALVGEVWVRVRPQEGGGYPEGFPVMVMHTCVPGGHLFGLSPLWGGETGTQCLPQSPIVPG